MNTIIKLASRNIWRNKRRTFITAAAIMFAVFFAIAMQSVQSGIWDNMEKGMVNSYMGYAQIHGNGFWEEKSLDYAMFLNDELLELEDKHDDIDALVPRIESFALASNGVNSKGILVVGIEPKKEDELTGVSKNIVDGDYFQGTDSTIIVAEGLANYFKIGIGDTLVLISQGYQGASAAGAYVVSALMKFASPELNKQMVYMPLSIAQDFFAAYDMASALVVNTNKPSKIKSTVAAIKKEIGDEYEVMDYEELMPDLMQARELDTAGNLFMLFILYAIITFGIFGTILMMIKERQYEFGVLTAIGMKRSKLSAIVWLETVFIGFIGTLAGMLLASPIVYILYVNPVKLQGEAASAYEQFGMAPLITSSTDPMIFINQAIGVFVIVTLLALYPLFKISKLQPVEAMRG